jgi:hypothetical protein
MPVRCTNIANTLGSLIAGLLSAALLLFIIGRPRLTSAQEIKQSHGVAKTNGNAKLIARGKYIVEGSRVAGTATRLAIRTATPTAQDGLRAHRCFINRLNRCRVGQSRRPGLPACHLGATPRSLHCSLPQSDAAASLPATRCLVFT